MDGTVDAKMQWQRRTALFTPVYNRWPNGTIWRGAEVTEHLRCMYWKVNVLIPPKIDPTDHWKKRGKNGKVKMKFQNGPGYSGQG